MENLAIAKTKDTLGVDFNADTGILELTGTSYPENTMAFFNDIYQWLDAYIETVGKKLILNCKVDYFNTTTSKCFLTMFDILESYHTSGKEVKVNWLYKNGETDEETGEELLEDYKFPYEITEY